MIYVLKKEYIAFVPNRYSLDLIPLQIFTFIPRDHCTPHFTLNFQIWICLPSTCNAGDLSSIPGSESSPGEGNGNPLQYSCLQNPMDGGAWWATVHGVAKSQTRLSDFTVTFQIQTKTAFSL